MTDRLRPRVRRFTSFFLIAMIVAFVGVPVGGQDRGKIPVTRWIDSEGRSPISYSAWKALQPPDKQLEVETIPSTLGANARGTGTPFCVIVSTFIYADIQPWIDRYVLAVTGEGYAPQVYVTTGGTPEGFRAFLQDRYGEGMQGCILVGDLPVPWYEKDCFDPPSHEEWPTDLFYMDMDGVFADGDGDGKYDSHTGDVGPEIWVGRLTASPLVMDGASEVDLLRNYFDKNHEYRCERRPLNSRALVYVDDDWNPWADAWDQDVGWAYSDRTKVKDMTTTWDTDYESRLPQNYEFIQVCVHSSPWTHGFRRPPDQWGWTENWEVKSIDPVAYFYNLFACSIARYVEYDYMAGWYVFCQDYGLAALGSTKTGAMLDFADFYIPLGNGANFGEAFMQWFDDRAVGGFDDDELCWHYGMTLIGDPTLVLYDADPEMTISTKLLSEGEVDLWYDEPLDVVGGTPPYTWDLTAGSLPNGLTLDAASGRIQGTPTAADSFVFTARVTDSDAPPLTDIQHLSIAVKVCVDADGDGFGDPGHPENYCPDDNCMAFFNPDQADSNSDGVGDACDCLCPYQGDLDADGFVTALDLASLIDVLFAGLPDPHDPTCRTSRSDLDCDQAATALDLSIMVDHLFIHGIMPCDPCVHITE